MALDIVKSFSLENLAEGWTSDCCIRYRPATYAQVKEIKATIDKVEAKKGDVGNTVIQIVKDHFVSGKGIALTNGTSALSDMSADDLADLPQDTIIDLYRAILGEIDDPKVETTSTAS